MICGFEHQLRPVLEEEQMTREEAKAKQDELEARGWNLSWWYGTKCEKCCGVYPMFCTSDANGGGCWYECEVCGKRTHELPMPWMAAEAWNRHEFKVEQIRMEV